MALKGLHIQRRCHVIVSFLGDDRFHILCDVLCCLPNLVRLDLSCTGLSSKSLVKLAALVKCQPREEHKLVMKVCLLISDSAEYKEGALLCTFVGFAHDVKTMFCALLCTFVGLAHDVKTTFCALICTFVVFAHDVKTTFCACREKNPNVHDRESFEDIVISFVRKQII